MIYIILRGRVIHYLKLVVIKKGKKREKREEKVKI